MFQPLSIFILLTLAIVFNDKIKVKALNNGLALRPPMGWLSWARYTCNVDCNTYPDSCVHEKLYIKVADLLVSEGYKDLGYDTVHIDDCWSELHRDNSTGRLIPDRQRFPSGIKALADYVHAKGLKLGIYGDVGPLTCGLFPGQNGPGEGYFEVDADTFAEWKVDAFKFDGCFEDPRNFEKLYTKMSNALNQTGAKILYHCEWPLYQTNVGIVPDYEKISKYCNMYRNYDDVEDRWTSITSIIDYYAANQELFSKYNGPGMWNDPDMLVIGNFGLSKGQSRTQMAMWSMWSAPLYMSTDLSNIDSEAKKILQNHKVIQVDQDSQGKFAKRILRVVNKNATDYEVWTKELTIQVGKYRWAVVYLNRYPLGDIRKISVPVRQLINCQTGRYMVEDLFEDEQDIPDVLCEDELTLAVKPSGNVRMVILTER